MTRVDSILPPSKLDSRVRQVACHIDATAMVTSSESDSWKSRTTLWIYGMTGLPV